MSIVALALIVICGGALVLAVVAAVLVLSNPGFFERKSPAETPRKPWDT